MPDAPAVAVLDVNETLVDIRPLRERFEAAGAPGHLLETWFASTLRDGFALTAAGAYADFQTVALEALAAVLASVPGLREEPRVAAERVLAGFPDLDLHPDVAPGLLRLREGGMRLVTLTNGSADLTSTLLERGGIADLVERQLSVSEAGRWKPAREPYLRAAKECGVPVGRIALIAVHPWDIDGATRAGMRGAWVNRHGRTYPHFFEPPAVTGEDLPALATALQELR